MGDRWSNRGTLSDTAWRSAVRLAVKAKRVREEASRSAARSTLTLYCELDLQQDAIPQYLSDRYNLEGTRLLTKCRMGYLWLMKAVAKTVRHGVVSPQCRLCNYNLVEDVEHFLLSCPVLEPCRQQLESRLLQILPQLGTAGATLMNRFRDGREGRLRVLLGDLSLPGGRQVDPLDQELALNQAGKARWYVDKCVKNFLLASWRLRESIVGSMVVAGGVLVVTPSKRSVFDSLDAQEGQQDADMSQVWVDSKDFWTEWIPAPVKVVTSWPVRKGPSAFYAVKVGRQTGIFYKWEDCMRSVAGVDDSVFCGRFTLAEAQ